MQHYFHRNTCRVCNSSDLVEILDLGQSPPANAYLSEAELTEPEEFFPLVLHMCRTCTLVQLLDVVDSDILFKDYHYTTGSSQPSVEHFQEYAAHAVTPFLRSAGDLVIDIGGNDGILLSQVAGRARVLNVDPADNLAPLSEARGVPFHAAFFGSRVAREIVDLHGPATVVTANNVIAHIDPVRDVMAGIATLIAETGVFVGEAHWIKHLIDTRCFDQAYHEHLCFYSLHALRHLVRSAGMEIFRVEIVPTQGLSLRIYAAKNRPVEASVGNVLGIEAAAGLTSEEPYLAFGEAILRNKHALCELLQRLKGEGKRIVGYGAPAKGNTLLNYYKVGPETLDYMTDSTPLKQGLYSPGMHVPIVAPERLHADVPDYALLLAWNFKDAILKREKALRDRGMKFIITVPELAVL